jgi:hypothetical protein
MKIIFAVLLFLGLVVALFEAKSLNAQHILADKVKLQEDFKILIQYMKDNNFLPHNATIITRSDFLSRIKKLYNLTETLQNAVNTIINQINNPFPELSGSTCWIVNIFQPNVPCTSDTYIIG